MGSFNIKCGLSGFSISPDQKYYAIPVIKKYSHKQKLLVNNQEIIHNADYSSTCYGSTFYYPLICPFLVKYQDYGTSDLIDKPDNIDTFKIFYDFLISQALDTVDDIFKVSKLKSFIDETNEIINYQECNEAWKYIEEANFDGNLFISDFIYKQNVTSLGFMAISQIAYNCFLKTKVLIKKEINKKFENGLEELKQTVYKTENLTLYRLPAVWHTYLDTGRSFLYKIVDNISKGLININDEKIIKQQVLPFLKIDSILSYMSNNEIPILPAFMGDQDYWNDQVIQHVNFLNAVKLAVIQRNKTDSDE